MERPKPPSSATNIVLPAPSPQPAPSPTPAAADYGVPDGPSASSEYADGPEMADDGVSLTLGTESLLSLLLGSRQPAEGQPPTDDGAPPKPPAQPALDISIDPSDEYELEAYLATLTSYDLERLKREPERLSDEAKRLKLEMEELAFKNYRTVIQSAQCITDVSRQVVEMQGSVDGLLQHGPQLAVALEQFGESAKQINEERRLNRITLNHHTQLLDLLEVPQLMNTCVRNEHYEEALDLQAFAVKLRAMHPDIPVVHRLVAEVKQYAEDMLEQLLALLRTNIQLPLCLRVIGYLRRLGFLREQELRLHFLRCRDAWLQSLLADIPTTPPYSYLIKTTDCVRVHLYDIVTHYRAIFFDDTSAQEEATTRDGGLLYAWVTHKLLAFTRTLEATLPLVTDGASLANVLEQCMYCGMSLGRVGVDFRGLLGPPFEKQVYALFSSNLRAAVARFSDALHAHKWLAPPPSLAPASATAPAQGTEAYTPPAQLLDHAPLAVAANGFLAALNELRLCAPVSLAPAAAAALSQALSSLVAQLALLRTERHFSEREEGLFGALAKCCGEALLPYVARCFDAVFHADAPLVNLGPLFSALAPLSASAPAPRPASSPSPPPATAAPAPRSASFSVPAPSPPSSVSSASAPLSSSGLAPASSAPLPSASPAASPPTSVSGPAASAARPASDATAPLAHAAPSPR
eukprot:tig00000144_g9040.t1